MSDYRVGDTVELELKCGRKFRLPITDIVGGRMWLDDGETRIQINSDGSVLILADAMKKPYVMQYYGE
jgi:hypothetical protein